MCAVKRQESDQPEEPVSAGKAPRDEGGERPEDKDNADVEGQAQAGPGGVSSRNGTRVAENLCCWPVAATLGNGPTKD